MLIEVDNREQQRIQTATKHYKQHDVEVKQLETADYIFNHEVAFEYKTLSDFVGSVENGRIQEQAIRLNKNFPYPFVIIQASDLQLEDYFRKIQFIRRAKKYTSKKPQKFYEKNFYGAIASLNRLVTVIRCPTEYRCFETMLVQAKKCLDNAPVNRKVAKTGNPAYQCLRYCIRSCGPKTAEKIVGELGLKSLKDVVNLSVEDLESVRGVSHDTAVVIVSGINGLC